MSKNYNSRYHEAQKSAGNNQWASPASVKSSVYENYKLNKKQMKAATNNHWC